MKIIPTVFEKDFNKAEDRIIEVQGTSTWIQIDVADGKFCQGKSFELELLTKVEKIDSKLLDIHLLVDNPIKWIGKCIFVGASRIIGQIEKMEDADLFVNKVKSEGMEAGLGFDIDSDLPETLPTDTDLVLLMSRKAGFEKYPFDRRVYGKIEKLLSIRDQQERDFLIGVDGGVGVDQISKLKNSGVDLIYSGYNYLKLINNDTNFQSN